MSTQDPTPPAGRSRPTPTDSTPDPLWAPTEAQRAGSRSTMPLGTPAPRAEPARTPYGQQPDATVSMPSADVPRLAARATVPPQYGGYDQRPSFEVPAVVERQVVAPPPKRSVWPYVIAVLALALGGAIGWLISRADDDEEDSAITADPDATAVVDEQQIDAELARRLDDLAAQTRATGEYVPGGAFPQVDEIVEIERSRAGGDLQNQVDLLSIANEDLLEQVGELEEDVAGLEESLAAAQAERDDLKAQLEGGGMTNDEFLARLQEKEDEITGLEDQLATLTTQLTEAQTAATRATEDLQRARQDLDAANAQLTALDVQQLERYVGLPVDRLRADATAHGWILLEQVVDAPQQAPGTVTAQRPDPGATVIRGSIIFVEFVRQP